MRSLRRALRYFEHVARVKSVRAASQVLHIAPSAVSRAVQQLEHEIGTPLFDRTIHGLRLTAAGQIVLTYAQRWERENERLTDALRSLAGGQRQLIRFASIEAAVYGLIPAAMKNVAQQVHGLQLDLKIGHTTAVLESVINGSADLGLTINLPRMTPVRSLWATRAPVGVITRPDHRFAGRPSISFEECAQEPMVLPEEGLAARTAINASLQLAGPCQVSVTSNRIAAVKVLVRQGFGISFLTRLDVQAEQEDGTLAFVELEGARIEHPFVSIIVARSARLSPVTELLIESLRMALPGAEFTE